MLVIKTLAVNVSFVGLVLETQRIAKSSAAIVSRLRVKTKS